MQAQRTSIHKRSYFNAPHLNTGSVSGSQYNNHKIKDNNPFDKSLIQVDDLLTKLFNKYNINK